MNPAEIIRRSARHFRDNVVIRFEGGEQTYGQMYQRSCRLVNALAGLGVRPGDRIAILGENSMFSVEQVAACALGNYPRVGLYSYNSPETNRYLLELVDARVLMTDAAHYPRIAPLLEGLPELRSVVVWGGTPQAGHHDYEALIRQASELDAEVPCAPDDVHIIRFSGGTTGKPKGIYHSNERWIAANNEWRWVTPMVSEHSTYLVPGSLAHVGIALLWNMLTVGARIVPLPSFDAGRVLQAFEEERVTHAAMAPVMIKALVEHPDCGRRDVSSLQCLLYAGSPIAPKTMRAAVEAFGDVLVQYYAQSEIIPISALLSNQHRADGSEKELRRLRSAGRGTPNVKLTIRDDDGNILPPGEVGEVAALSPGNMNGLWKEPEATRARLLPDGSILTRDMGYLDEDGFLYLVDRKDDMIISGGYNIWPAELEAILSAHPAVAEACVIGIPHEKWGETPLAFVVLVPGKTVTEEELITLTREKAGSIKKISGARFIEQLPRSPAGKLLRRSLREPLWASEGNRIRGA